MKIKPYILFFLLTIGTNFASSMPAKSEKSPSLKWLDAPWDIRYFIFINSEKHMKIDMSASENFNAKDGKNGQSYIYLDAKELLFSIKKTIPTKTVSIAKASIVFNNKGEVLNEEYPLHRFTGKLSILGSFVLVEQSSKKSLTGSQVGAQAFRETSSCHLHYAPQPIRIAIATIGIHQPLAVT